MIKFNKLQLELVKLDTYLYDRFNENLNDKISNEVTEQRRELVRYIQSMLRMIEKEFEE